MSEQLMSVNDAAKRLGVSGQYVRVLEQLGRLTAMRTVGGVRIFKASDVEALVIEREKQLRLRQERQEQTGREKVA